MLVKIIYTDVNRKPVAHRSFSVTKHTFFHIKGYEPAKTSPKHILGTGSLKLIYWILSQVFSCIRKYLPVFHLVNPKSPDLIAVKFNGFAIFIYRSNSDSVEEDNSIKWLENTLIICMRYLSSAVSYLEHLSR